MAALPIVRRRVRDLLESSPGFRSLPPDERRQIADDTVKVAAYMADPGGLVSREFRVPLLGARARKVSGASTVRLGHTLQRGSTAFDELLSAVDFPDFVAELIHGVFDAIVDAALVASVAKSVDGFVSDAIDDAAARDTLAGEYPELFCPKPGRKASLAWRADADPAAARRLQAALGLRQPEPDLRRLVAATRRRMARNRQQLLATTVLMGINRIVVTDGRIKPKIRFDLVRR